MHLNAQFKQLFKKSFDECFSLCFPLAFIFLLSNAFAELKINRVKNVIGQSTCGSSQSTFVSIRDKPSLASK